LLCFGSQILIPSIHAFLIRPRAVPFAASTLHADESGGANPSPCPLLDRRGIRNRDGHRCLLERQCTGASSPVERTKRKVATGDTPISTYAHVDGRRCSCSAQAQMLQVFVSRGSMSRAGRRPSADRVEARVPSGRHFSTEKPQLPLIETKAMR
jgi:hypothetical protein